jgi:hypothetical protein
MDATSPTNGGNGGTVNVSLWMPTQRKHDFAEALRYLKAKAKGTPSAFNRYVHVRGKVYASLAMDAAEERDAQIVKLFWATGGGINDLPTEAGRVVSELLNGEDGRKAALAARAVGTFDCGPVREVSAENDARWRDLMLACDRQSKASNVAAAERAAVELRKKQEKLAIEIMALGRLNERRAGMSEHILKMAIESAHGAALIEESEKRLMASLASIEERDHRPRVDAPKYLVRCDDCKKTIGQTDSLRESAAGGRCDECSAPKPQRTPSVEGRRASVAGTPRIDCPKCSKRHYANRSCRKSELAAAPAEMSAP